MIHVNNHKQMQIFDPWDFFRLSSEPIWSGCNL